MKLAAWGARGLFFLSVVSFGAAKDLSGRFGLGATNIGPQGQTPTLSLDWHANRAAHFEGNLGMRSKSRNNLLIVGGRYSRNLYIEEQTLFFMYLGAGLLSEQIQGDSKSGYQLETGAGAKYFFSGLSNVGFSTRAGFLLKSLGGVSFQSVVNFGFHYYF